MLPVKSFERTDRIRHQLLREIADALRRSVKGYDLTSVTLTDVEVSRDCKYATAYYTVMQNGPDREEIAARLDKVRSVVQSEVGRRLGIRVVPHLDFVFDDSIERGLRLGDLFSEIEAERKNGQADSKED
jgi:ribosome-binding factor A